MHRHWSITLSFPGSYGNSNFNTFSCPIICIFSNSSMNSMLSWIILVFLNSLRLLSIRIRFFFINSHSTSCKWPTLFLLALTWFDKVAWIHLVVGWFFIIERRSKINFHISIDDANSIILVFGFYFNDINFEFARKCCNGDSVSFMKTREIS